MELLIREFNECAVDGTEAFGGQPARAKKALLRLNAIHAKYSNVITYRCVRSSLSSRPLRPYFPTLTFLSVPILRSQRYGLRAHHLCTSAINMV